MNELVLSILGVLMGGLITLIASRRYYERASADLVSETARLRALHVLTLRALEHAGIAEFGKDEHGVPVGLQHRFKGETVISVTSSGELSANVGKSSGDGMASK